jgi:hypothetical protein
MTYRPERMDRPGSSSQGYNGRFTEIGARDGYENRIPSTRAEIHAQRLALALELERARMTAHRCDETPIP